jgi:tetratricopeptide (TPR) repeat protein
VAPSSKKLLCGTAFALAALAACAPSHVGSPGEWTDKRSLADRRLNAALESARYDEALRIADSLVASGAGDPRAIAQRARALGGLGREKEAIAAYEEALLQDYESCDHHLQFATYLMRVGKTGRAHTEFMEAKRFCGQSYSRLIYRNLAVAAVKLGKLDLARRYVDEGLGESPGDPYLSGIKGMLIAREHPSEAESLFVKAAGPGEAPVEFLVQYGLLLINNAGRSAEAVGIFEKASRAEPGNREIRAYLAEALDRTRKYAEAEAIFRDLLAAKDDPEIRLRLAHALFHEGSYGEALKLYVALEQTPEVMDRIAMCQQGLGKSDDAILWERKALSAKPDWPQAMINLAVILASKGQLDEAASLLERVLELEPDNVAARSNLERLRGAQKK